MAIKDLKKDVKVVPPKIDKKLEQFISKGGDLPMKILNNEEEHRLTLRIPKHLMELIDKKRKKRVGKISRNLWLVELIEKATRK